MKKYKNVAFLLLFYALPILLLSITIGYNNIWLAFGVPAYKLPFLDTSVITFGADAIRNNVDPMIANPSHPFQNPLNYPRVWQVLYTFGLDSRHTIILGIIFITSFFIGISILLFRADKKTFVVGLLSLYSPAVLFGLERGNSDLFIFFLLCLFVLLIRRYKFLAIAIAFLATTLKIYPIFALLPFLKDRDFKIRSYSLIALIFSLAYFLLTRNDLYLISTSTPRETFNSYGANVLWMYLCQLGLQNCVQLRVTSYVVASGCILTSLLWNRRLECPSLHSIETNLSLDSFKVGAAIYCGTFLLGNNWMYRLIFLIFTIPQFIVWTRVEYSGIRFVAKLGCVVSLLCQWSLIYQSILWISSSDRHALQGNEFLFQNTTMPVFLAISVQALHWLLFIAIAYLLGLLLNAKVNDQEDSKKAMLFTAQ